MTTAKRPRGKWASPTQAQRVSKKRTVTLPPDLHAAADALVASGENLSEIVARAMRHDPLIVWHLDRLEEERAREKDRASQKES